MRPSRASLVVGTEGGATVVRRAFAEAPQRWVVARAGGPFADVTHQVLGDGVLGGDRLRTTIQARQDACVTVRGLAATALRRGGMSVAAVRLRAAAGSTLMYLPGVVVPHAGSDHRSSLQVRADRGARVAALSLTAPGRVAMGESGAFARLQVRTRATMGERLVFAETTEIDPRGWDSVAPGETYAVVAAALCLGEWIPAQPAWWQALASDDAVLGASHLREGGVAMRGLFPSLGAALAFGARFEVAVRDVVARG